MTDKKARFLQTEDEIEIGRYTTPDFLLLYQQAVLLALKEQGTINDVQCQMCIDTLISQFEKSAHSSKSYAGAMLSAKGDGKC